MPNLQASLILLAGVAAIPLSSAAGAPTPTATKVKFSGSAGAYDATISGKSFGQPPAGVPCNACSIPEFTLIATHNIFASLTYNITGWTNTKITLTSISGNAGDAVHAAVRNDAADNVATWGGNFPGGKGNPVISSVTFSGQGAHTAIIVTGTGLAQRPKAFRAPAMFHTSISFNTTSRTRCNIINPGGGMAGSGDRRVGLTPRSSSPDLPVITA